MFNFCVAFNLRLMKTLSISLHKEDLMLLSPQFHKMDLFSQLLLCFVLKSAESPNSYILSVFAIIFTSFYEV